MLKVYDERTDEEVKPGDTLTDFRGDKVVFLRATRERIIGKSGKVYVELPNGSRMEFYDKVFNVVVKDVFAGMQWKQPKSSEWVAEGKDGKFVIERSRGKFWARYCSEDCTFKMPPKSKLSEAKEMCENNVYWEYSA